MSVQFSIHFIYRSNYTMYMSVRYMDCKYNVHVHVHVHASCDVCVLCRICWSWLIGWDQLMLVDSAKKVSSCSAARLRACQASIVHVHVYTMYIYMYLIVGLIP